MADQDDLDRLHTNEIDFARSDLRKANLSRLDLSGRDFTGAHLEEAIAHGTNFSRCALRNFYPTNMSARDSDFSETTSESSIFVQVDFERCDFSRSRHRASHFTRVNFNNVDFSGADFTGSHFNEGTSFDGATSDASTRFDGVTIFRPLAKDPVFRFYKFERGMLVRLDEPSGAAREQIESGAQSPLEAKSPATASFTLARVQRRITQQPTEVAVMAIALAEAIDEHITELATKKPNEPQALQAHEGYVSFLGSIAEGLRDIHSTIAHALQSTAQPEREADLSRAARIASKLGDDVEGWIGENARTVIDYGVKTTLLGAGTAFLAFCGIPAWEAFIPLASHLSGGTFFEGVKALMKSRK